jgi:hypothetical protein
MIRKITPKEKWSINCIFERQGRKKSVADPASSLSSHEDGSSSEDDGRIKKYSITILPVFLSNLCDDPI